MNNQVLETIMKRRTTRVFKDEKIKQEDLLKIIEAGTWAPSGHNMQAWHFTAIENQEILAEINEKTKEAAKNFYVEDIRKMANNPKFNVFYNAPVVILVSYDEKALTPVQDISAASQNILLAAESMGIGACWNGFVSFLFSNEEARKYYSEKLNIPVDYKLSHAIALGYSKSEKLNPPTRKENTYTIIK